MAGEESAAASSPPTSAAPIAPVAIFKKPGAKRKANMRKRPATPPPAHSDSDDSDYTSSEDESGQRVKRRKKNAVVTASSKNNAAHAQHESATVFAADRSAPVSSSNDATKTSNWYDEDANLLGKTRPLPSAGSEPAQAPPPAQPDGTYKGLANRTTFIQKNPNAPNRTVGPVKAPTNIRTVTTTDFAPDVCKDYKKTGFCGFGDNCKFLHAREDYAQGWKLDQDWEKVNKGKKNTGGTVVASADRTAGVGDKSSDEADAAMLEKIPFKCIICEGDYKSPVRTKCGHYFCEPCALKRYRSDPSCKACGSATGGVFNTAKALGKLLERKKEREDRLKEDAAEDGGDGS